MSFTLARFRDVDLPEFNPIAQAGSRTSLAPRARMADGRVYDRLGDTQAPQGAGTVVYVANYYDNEPYIAETKYLALLAEVGKAGWLYRQRIATGTYERIWARLDAVNCPQDWRFPGLISNIQLSFFVVDPTWNGQRHGSYEPAFGSMKQVTNSDPPGIGSQNALTVVCAAGTSSATGTPVNGGNAPASGFVIIIAPVSANHTGGIQIDYVNGGVTFRFQYTATITWTTPIYIDTYAKQVYDSSLNGKYASFGLVDAVHESSDWLVVPEITPATFPTDVTVSSITGNFPTGGVNVSFHFADAWQ